MTQRGCKYHPALKHALFFACGIALAHTLNVPPDALLISLVLSLLWIAAAVRFNRLVLPLAVIVSVGVSGALYSVMREGKELPVVSELELKDVELAGNVVSDPVVKDGWIEWRLAPDSLLYRNSTARLSSEVVVRLRDSSASLDKIPGYGAKMTAKGTFRLPSAPRYPGEFDYGAWLRSQGIAGTFDCNRRQEVYVYGREETGILEQTTRSVRLFVRRFVHDRVGGEEGDILMALLLGDRGDIDPTTRDAFARTGTSHILAVSGLHVGIIALALFVCVSWFRNRWLRFGLFGGMLGLYTLLVGSPPSVLRAAVMAVVLLLAYNIGRLTRPLNTLGVAGLLLLLIDPAWLFDVGFQLSFAAVAGIVIFYIPSFERLTARYPRSMANLLLRRVAQLFLVSVSAQLFTFPLTLHYFGFVSIISPLVNIVAVPLTTFGLGAGAAGVMTSNLPFLADSFGAAAWLAIGATLELVSWSAAFEDAGVQIVAFGSLIALILFIGVIYLSLSISIGQLIVRCASVVMLAIVLIMADRRLDPLADSHNGYVYVVPLTRAGGIVAALHRHDTLTVCYGGLNVHDSGAAARIGDRLARRIGVGVVRTIDLANPRSQSLAEDHDLRLVNRSGPEYAGLYGPVLLSNTRRRSPGYVRIERTMLAQIPLQRKIERTIVLDPRPDWRLVPWE